MNNDKPFSASIGLDPSVDEVGDGHVATSVDTPIREDAFERSNEEKIKIIRDHFKSIMDVLGLDTSDESLKGTPDRVAKMFVNEVFSGLDPKNLPAARKFTNKFDYSDMIVEKNIQVNSFCEHHFLPFIGKAHVAYISSGHVIGLSKINRIVDYYSRRPQVQERLTLQIGTELSRVLETEDVAVYIESRHFCVSMRGIRDNDSSTITSDFRGKFQEPDIQKKFIDYIKTETAM